MTDEYFTLAVQSKEQDNETISVLVQKDYGITLLQAYSMGRGRSKHQEEVILDKRQIKNLIPILQEYINKGLTSF